MDWLNGAIVFGVAFAVTFISVPLSKRIAAVLGAIDYPSNRRVNVKPVPRCGGIALFLGLHAAIATLLIGMSFFGWELNNLYEVTGIDYLLLYAGVVIMFCVGLVDDITQIKALPKFVGQVVAASIIVAAGVSIGIIRSPLSYNYIDLGWANYPVSVLYLVVFVNIINLIDGLDGLASGTVAIMAAALLYLVVQRGNMTLAFVCIALVAVCLAFLCFNFYPASVFMGDSGSMLLGITLGIVAISGVTRAQGFVLALVPLAIAGVPVLDTVSAIVRRLRGHESIGHADTEHIHHRLMHSGLGQLRSVAVLWTCSAVLAGVSIALSNLHGPIRWALFALLLVVVFLVIWKFGLFKPVLRHHYDNFGKTGPRLPRNMAKHARISADAGDSQAAPAPGDGGGNAGDNGDA